MGRKGHDYKLSVTLQPQHAAALAKAKTFSLQPYQLGVQVCWLPRAKPTIVAVASDKWRT